jgi:hypothetical protein
MDACLVGTLASDWALLKKPLPFPVGAAVLLNTLNGSDVTVVSDPHNSLLYSPA